MTTDPTLTPPGDAAEPERHATDGEITNRLDAAIEWVGKGFSWLVSYNFV